MTEGTRKLPFVLYGLLLVLAAYAPLVTARLVGDDWATLARATSGLASESPSSPAPAGESRTDLDRPFASFSLELSARVLAPKGGWSSSDAWRLRAENLLWLLLAGLGVHRFVRRGLQPWTGSEQANAAGRAAALLFAVHPLAVSSVARLASRGDLLALAAATWACTAFLTGRQLHKHAPVLLALFLTALAVASSPRAWFLPCVLAGLEYTSARRHRPRLQRARTSLTTLVVFGALVPLERALDSLIVGAGATASAPGFLGLETPVDWAAIGAAYAEKVGMLLLPVNTEGIVGALGYALAAAFLALALQPAFVAARSAPRLWGRILLGWLLSVLVCQIPDAAARVAPSELARAHFLLVPALLVAIGLGIASTALSGIRRVLVPALLALPYAVLARANALPWVEAGERVHELQRDIVNAARDYPGATIAVVDLPPNVRGLDAFAPALAWLLAPVYLRGELTGLEGPTAVRSIGLDGLFMLLRQSEASELRANGLVLLLPARLTGGTSEVGHVWWRLSSAEGGDGRWFWRKESNSPAGMLLDPLVSRSVRVKSVPGTEPAREPLVRWIARSSRFSAGERAGTWIEGEDGPIACFDLGRDLGWLLGERVSSMWFPGVLVSITSAEVMAEPPPIGLAGMPQVDGPAWRFDLRGWARPRSLGGEGYWIFGLLDLESWRYVELPALGHDPEGLVVPDASATMQELARESPGRIAWTLEWRVAGVTLARASGRTELSDPPAPSR
jgi:hypothetical protein